MSPDAIKQITDRIKQHKILFAILVVGMSLILVGGVCFNDSPPENKADKLKAAEAKPAQQPAPAPPAATFDANLATQFVKWWATQAMDYSVNTAKANHVEALRWMTPQAAQAFQSCFWTPQMEQEILAGHVAAAFQPVTVEAKAVNPDGTIVVELTGTLVMQSTNTTPVSQQISTDFLVKQDPQGLRICALYNRSTISAAAPAPY